MPNTASQIIPILTGENTDAQLANQGYTYNQAGLTYNQVGVMYGGVYNTNEDVVPLVSLAEQVTPDIFGYSDIYTQFIPPSGNSGMLIGILGLTYP